MLILILLSLATVSHYKTFLVAYLVRRLLKDCFLETYTNVYHSVQVWRIRLILARKTKISNSDKDYVSTKYRI
jgi:hypothetical protein